MNFKYKEIWFMKIIKKFVSSLSEKCSYFGSTQIDDILIEVNYNYNCFDYFIIIFFVCVYKSMCKEDIYKQ